jgi:ubiquinone/menaquinone biosynthesis C-methylase UbiE
LDKITANRADEFYDSLSSNYDEILEKGHISSIIRKYIQNKLTMHYNRGDKVLDIGCGTGIDALFLAKNGVNITAIDPSPGMLMVAKNKAAEEGLKAQIEFIQMRAEDLNNIAGKQHTGAYSDFDALNYVKDLGKFSSELSGILKPGSKVIFVMLNKVCFAEWFYYLISFKPITAFRKLFYRSGTLEQKLKLYFPPRVKKIFSDNFKCVSIKGFGILLPPDSFSGFYSRLKWFFKIAEKIERLMSPLFIFYNFSDHFIIELEKK